MLFDENGHFRRSDNRQNSDYFLVVVDNRQRALQVDENSGDDAPDKVRFYVGLKTTDHPLFQAGLRALDQT